MSEFARVVLKLPVSPERERDDRERKRLFDREKVKFKAAIVRDKRLTDAQRRIGYELADKVNFKTGYAWPSQEWLAEKVGLNERTVRRATAALCDEKSGWFRREFDNKSYCYFPRFDQLNDPAPPVENTGHLERQIPDIQRAPNVRLYSLGEPSIKENSGGACGEAIERPALREPNNRKMADRGRKVLDFGNQDELLTNVARAEGKPAFVFLDSQPWQLWSEYRVSQGLPPLQPQHTRQHMSKGVMRTGVDMPSLYPPGYGCHSIPRDGR